MPEKSPIKSVKGDELSEKQIETYVMARGRKGFLHFEEQGCGKSAMVLAEFKWAYDRGIIDRMFIICPNSLKLNWVLEVEKWGLTMFNTYIWPHEAHAKMTPEPPFIVMMNYEAVGVGSGFDWIKKHMDGDYAMIAVDESIHIKNPTSRRTNKILDLCKKIRYRRVLSGAPSSQGAQDLYAQFRAIGLMNGVKYTVYKNEYCTTGGYMGKKLITKKNKVGELNDIIMENGSRFTLEELGITPAPIDGPIRTIIMTKDQKRIYLEMMRDFIAEIREGKLVEVEMVITQMLKLLQISSGIIIDEDREVNDIMPLDKNPKLIEVRNALGEVSGKTLIFTKFRGSTQRVYESCLEWGYSPNVLRGGMTGQEVEDQKAAFNRNPNNRVCVIQSESHMYGHTLLGGPGPDRCKNSFYYETDYSLNTRIQTESRNVRIGQDESVVYTDFVASNTEMGAILALREKREVATAIMDIARGHVPSRFNKELF